MHGTSVHAPVPSLQCTPEGSPSDRDAQQVPLERWDIERVYAPGLASDRMYARHAAWLGGVDRFDAALFGFSKAQATATDPQVLLGGYADYLVDG